MANEFLNAYTDHLRDEYLRFKKCSEQAEKNRDFKRHSLQEGLMFETWSQLYAYMDIVLRRRRFRSQTFYAQKVLIELNETMFNAFRNASRKRKWKKEAILQMEMQLQIREEQNNNSSTEPKNKS